MASVFEVDGAPLTINWAPATERDEILQNVRSLLSSVAGTIPLARGVGISADVVDAPMSKAKATLMTATYRAITRNEPRARVLAIYVDEVDPNSGRIVPRVKIAI